MNVSCSMVGRPYSEVSSTALRQHGGCQNRLRSKEQPPLIRKVRSGAVNNASQLKNPLNLNPIIRVIRNIPKKERSKSVEKGKWLFFSRLIGGIAWNSLWSTSTGFKMGVLWSTDHITTWVIGYGLL